MTKHQLALLYFPESSPRVAVNHLNRWIKTCRPLYQELLAMGYHPRNRHFTPKEINRIFFYLGEP